MPKVWSLNTTVRNPERIKDFLKVLSEFEGQIFDNRTQALFQKALVRHKLYRPNNIPEDLKMEYDNVGDFNEEDTNIIFSFIKDPSLRGRTSASKCTQMGLAIAKKSEGPVIITSLGKELLNDQLAMEEEFFFNYFIKWQLPNPIDTGYTDFDINPFLATLYIINKVNDLEEQRHNKRKGISKKEFALFIIPLKDYREIDNTIEAILNFRDLIKQGNDEFELYTQMLNDKVVEIFDVIGRKDIIKKSNNLVDYADSAIRWFRNTQYLMYRGNKHYVDIAETRLEQAIELVKNLSLSSNHYDTVTEYRDYLVNRSLPKLPWDVNIETTEKIIIDICNLIEETQNKIDQDFPNQRNHNFETNPQFSPSISISELRTLEKEYRKNFEIINNEYRTHKESDLKNLNKYIKELKELGNLSRNNKKNNAPLCLEWYTSLSLMALDDSLEIKPNIIKADDGLPLFTAGGGVPDIECYYKSFNLIVEVTLIRSKNQVTSEVLPVSRHFVDSKKKSGNKTCYCLFLAPSIHRDALNQFYYFINNSVEGYDLNLIPLTIEQYTNLLEIILENSDKGKNVNQKKLEEFFNYSLKKLKEENDSTKWYDTLNSYIQDWGKSFS